MGASQSTENRGVISDYELFVLKFNLNDPTIQTINSLVPLLDTKLLNAVLGNEIVNSNVFTEEHYDKLIETFRSTNLSKLIKYVVNKDIVSYNELYSVLQMFLLNNKSDIAEIVMKSFHTKSSEEKPVEYNIDLFCNWVDKNLPDLVLDLSLYIKSVLLSKNLSLDLSDCMKITFFNFKSTILNSSVPTVHLLLSGLSSYYKTSKANRHMITLTQVANWVLLYSREIDGHSNSKLREKSFEYPGAVLLLIKSVDDSIFCLATENGLKEDFNPYGGPDTCFMKLSPIFQKYVSGSRSSGVVYSNFSTKTGKRGIFIGHNPLGSPAAFLDEDLSCLTVLSSPVKISKMEVWAVGANVSEFLGKFKDIRKWEEKEVEKHKNRKLKVDDWQDSPDRELLNWGGVNVKNTDLIGQADHKNND